MTDYRGFRITTIHAIVGIGEDDEEAIPAMHGPDGTVMPMMASDRVRLDIIKDMAQQIADATGRNFKVVRFSVREDIGEIKSKRSN